MRKTDKAKGSGNDDTYRNELTTEVVTRMAAKASAIKGRGGSPSEASCRYTMR